MTEVTLLRGDCVEEMARMDACSVDAVVTDPPYGLEFMGREWDRLVAPARGRTAGSEHAMTLEGRDDTPQHRAAVRQPSYLLRCAICGGNSSGAWNRCACAQPDFRGRADLGWAMQEWHYRWAVEALRVLKPGGYLLAFGGTRTCHRLACAVEDAGFEIRDRVLVLGADGEAEWADHPTELAWLYGSGFPKSLDVSKAIDKAAGAEREVVGTKLGMSGYSLAEDKGPQNPEREVCVTAPATEEAAQWQGWGTALKPAHEPIVVARKPLSGTVAQTVLEYGTGALNIDGCRVGYESGGTLATNPSLRASVRGGNGGHVIASETESREMAPHRSGRWPANVCLVHHDECVRVGDVPVESDGHWPAARGEGGLGTSGHSGQEGLAERSFRRVRPGNGSGKASARSRGFQSEYVGGEAREGTDLGEAGFVDEGGYEMVEAWECHPDCAVRQLDEQSGAREGGHFPLRRSGLGYGGGDGTSGGSDARDATGGASRFFYTAKASRAERELGLIGVVPCGRCGQLDSAEHVIDGREGSCVRCIHPTVKPIALMRWLVRLVTPPGGTCLDPFMGSGTTGIACSLEDRDFVGIEKYPRDGEPGDPDYFGIAQARIGFWREHGADGLRIVREREAAERRSEERRSELSAAGQEALF